MCAHSKCWTNSRPILQRNTSVPLTPQVQMSVGHQPAHGRRLPHALRRHHWQQAHECQPQSPTPPRHGSLGRSMQQASDALQENDDRRIESQSKFHMGPIEQAFAALYSLSLCTCVFSAPPLFFVEFCTIYTAVTLCIQILDD